MSLDATPSDTPLETATAPAHDDHAHEVPAARPLWIILGLLIAALVGMVAVFGAKGVFLAALALVPVIYGLMIWVAKG